MTVTKYLFNVEGLKKPINIWKGDFWLSEYVTSLEGCPKIITGEFGCTENQIQTYGNIKLLPKEVHGNFTIFNAETADRFEQKDLEEFIRKVCNVQGIFNFYLSYEALKKIDIMRI
jgi:hypothetical protein